MSVAKSGEAAVATTPGRPALRPRLRDRFYLAMSGLLLAIVLVGFTPTLYLRPWFDVQPMPFYLYVHGVLLTAWYAMLFAQAWLVGAGNLALHRTIGWFLAGFALIICGAGMMAQLLKNSRLTELGVDLAARFGRDLGVFWSNTLSSIAFLGLVGAAILLRARAESHKRLMLLASVALMSPPSARFARWPMFSTAPDLSTPVPLEREFAVYATLILLTLFVVHDVVVKRRVLLVTLVGCAVIFSVRLGVPLIAATETGQAIYRAMP